MSYRFLKDLSKSDVAVEIKAKSAKEIFEEGAKAFNGIIVKRPQLIGNSIKKRFFVQGSTMEDKIFDFFDKLIYYKDVHSMLFSEISLGPGLGRRSRIEVKAAGSGIDTDKLKPIVDIKAVTMHKLSVVEKRGAFTATVVFDV